MEWKSIQLKFDSFDRNILLCTFGLMLAAALYASFKNSSTEKPAARSADTSIAGMFSELATARALVDTGASGKALPKLKAFDAAHPGVAETHLLLARAYAAQQEYPSAIKEYRATLMLDPEYADKTSAKFIGKGIKSVMLHGWAPCEITLNPSQDSPEQKAVLEDARYIQRMLAGGCE